MKCPVCGAWTSVIETRTRKDGTKRRRYGCANEHRFTTQESLIDFRGRSGTDMADVQEARGPHPSFNTAAHGDESARALTQEE